MNKKNRKTKTMAKSQVTKNTRTRRLFILTLLSFLLLVLLPGIALYYLSKKEPLPIPSIGGVDIRSDCSALTDAYVSFQLNFQTLDADVIQKINNWDQVVKSCHTFQFAFPGIAIGYQYVVDLATISANPWDDPSLLFDKRKSRKEIKNISWDPILGQSVVKVNSKDYEGFSGVIEFRSIQQVYKTGYSEYEMYLSFEPIDKNKEGFVHVSKYNVSLVAPTKYKLVSNTPEPRGYKTLANISFYWFDLTPGKSLLKLKFEDLAATQSKDRQNIIFLAILGIGLGLLITETFALIKHNFIDKEA